MTWAPRIQEVDMRFLTGVIIAAALAGAAESGPLGNFECVALKDTASLEIASGKIKINNIRFQEIEDPVFNTDGLRVYEVTYSATNSGNRPYHMSGQFAVFGPEGKLLASLEASPSMDFIGPGKSAQADGEVYVVPGSMQTAETVCFNFVGKSDPALPG